ncbi:MAG: MFS transporter [Gammaproteobacteria bacterium]|nr:MFS transporter [Gammaproteobacteria bacterium]
MDENNSQDYNFWYFLTISAVFILANTTFSTPLIGLGYEMSSDYNERTRLMGLANIVGQVAWMVVPWFWVLIADQDLFATQAEGVRTLSVIVGVIAIIFGILPAIFCRGIDSSKIENRQEISFKNLLVIFANLFKGMFEVFRHKPFLKLCGATFLVFNGFQIVASFSFFIILFYLFNGDYAAAGTWPAWFSTILAVVTAFLVIPLVAWMVVPWFWVLIADVTLFETQAEGVRTLAFIVGIIAIVFGVLPAIFCQGIDSSKIENRQEISLKNMVTIFGDLFKGMFEVFRHKPFLKLCGATFLVFNGFQIVASFSFFIILFYLFNGDYAAAGTWPAWFSTILAVITAFFVIPVVAWMASKYGKRTAFVICTAISIVGYVLKWWGFNPENPFLMFLPLPLMAFGMGCLFTLMMSMTADICDLDELTNGMPRKEGTFGAIYWWTVKLGQALALIVGGAVLSWVGFDGNAATQSAETITQLRIADIVIPSITAGLAILVMWNYDLTEEKAREIKAELESRRGAL